MNLRRTILGTSLVAALLAAPSLWAGWASLGAMPSPRREGNTLLFGNAQGVVALTVVAPDIVRVRFSPTPGFGRDHSYAVASRDLGDPGAAFDVRADASTITTAALKVTVRHD